VFFGDQRCPVKEQLEPLRCGKGTEYRQVDDLAKDQETRPGHTFTAQEIRHFALVKTENGRNLQHALRIRSFLDNPDIQKTRLKSKR